MNPEFANAFHWPPQLPQIREALIQAFDSGEWGRYEGGPCKNLVEKIQTLLDLSFVRLCSSGTIAVEIALAALGVQEGDEVVLAAYDFPGNFRAIERLGGLPVLADIDSNSWCIDSESMTRAITENTKAVIVSHLHGGIAEIEKIVGIANERQVKVVEDICQCPGARIDGRPLGTFGDICATSFGGSKLLSAGRGGAIATSDEAIMQRAKIFCERGNDAYPMSNLQAASLIPQLEVLDELAAQRRKSVSSLNERMRDCEGVRTQQEEPGHFPDYYKVPFLLPGDVTGPAKEKLIGKLRELGIVIDHGFRGFAGRSERRCRKPVNLNCAEEAARRTLVLHHPCLLSEQLDSIADQIIDAVNQN